MEQLSLLFTDSDEISFGKVNSLEFFTSIDSPVLRRIAIYLQFFSYSANNFFASQQKLKNNGVWWLNATMVLTYIIHTSNSPQSHSHRHRRVRNARNKARRSRRSSNQPTIDYTLTYATRTINKYTAHTSIDRQFVSVCDELVYIISFSLSLARRLVSGPTHFGVLAVH